MSAKAKDALRMCIAALLKYAEEDEVARGLGKGVFDDPERFIGPALGAAYAALDEGGIVDD